MALLSLVAKLGLNTTGFDQGLNKASQKVLSFGSGIKSALAGAFSVAAVGAFLRGLNQTIGRIKDLSEQFGVTTDEVQNADFALKQSGMSFEDLAQSMARMGEARRKAVEDGGELREVLKKYGLEIEDLNNPQKRNFDLLLMMADAMSRMNITAREQSQIQDVLGAKALRLSNVLASLATTKPPNLFTQQDIEKIDKASKAIDNLSLSIQKMVAPSVGRFADTLRVELEKLASSNAPWYKKLFTTSAEGGPIAKAITSAVLGDFTPENIVKQIAKGPADLLGNAAGGILNKILPAPAAPDNAGISQLDKNVKDTPFAQPTALSGADQLGRIGAFSGGPSNNVNAQLKKSNDTLTAIQRVLEVRGIKIQEL